MMAKQSIATAVPELRFPEFREAPDWTCGKARDIVDVLQGYGFPERFQGSKDGEFPFYKVSDISACVDAGGVFLTDANNHIDSDTMAELRAKPMPVEATVFAKIGEAIRSNKRAITTRPCLVDNNAAGVKAIAGLARDRFVYYLWCQVPLIEYAGGVVPSVNKSAIEQIQVSYPQPDEQKKISDCLTSLDEVIAAQGRKVEALKAHKRGLIQQLFPREGETRPGLRFPEFHTAPEWTLGKASDIVAVLQGYGFPERLQGSTDGEFPFYKVSDISACVDAGGIFLDEANNHIDAGVLEELRAKPMPVGATVFAKIGEAIRSNKRAITTRLCLVDNNAAGVKAIEGLAQDRFVYYWWCQVPLIEYAGGVVPAVNKSTIEQIAVCYPEPDEQQRIADCLASLDSQITAECHQLAALKTHKQGLMRQLFPAPEAASA